MTVMTTTEFGDALRRRLDELDQTQEWLGVEVARIEGRSGPVAQTTVSNWVNGRAAPKPATAVTIEKALGVRPGSLTRLLGYVAADVRFRSGVPEAIRADPYLNDLGRRVLLATYDELVDEGPEGP